MGKDITVNEMSKSTPVLGILSIVFGGISMVPLLGIVSPIGLVLGIIALVKKQRITGVIGTSISTLGIATSPLLWALVLCTANPSADACKPKDKPAMEQLQPAQNLTPEAPVTTPETTASSTVQLPIDPPVPSEQAPDPSRQSGQ